MRNELGNHNSLQEKCIAGVGGGGRELDSVIIYIQTINMIDKVIRLGQMFRS